MQGRLEGRHSTWRWVDRGASALAAAAAVILILDAVPRLQMLSRALVVGVAFTPYAWLMANIAAIMFVLGRRRVAAGALCIALMGVGLWTARGYWRASEAPLADPAVTLATMNLRCRPAGAGELTQLLRRREPDVVVLNGASRRVRDQLVRELDDVYPSVVFSPMPGLSWCGSVVLSQHPISGWLSNRPHPTVVVDAPQLSFELVAVDFPTPTRGLPPWVEAFDDLTFGAGDADLPLVALGDFNAVMEHEPMRRLVEDTNLQNAVLSSKLGWLPTFPSSPLPSLVALDHAMVSDELVASSALTAVIDGQQHRALFVTLGPKM